MADYLRQLKSINEQICNVKRLINIYKKILDSILKGARDPATGDYQFSGDTHQDIIFYANNKSRAGHTLDKLRKRREFVLNQKEIAEALDDSDVLSLYEAFSNQGSQTQNFTYLNESDRQHLVDLLKEKLSKIRLTRKKSDLDPNPKINFFIN